MKRIDLSVLIGIVAAVVLASLTGFSAECEEIRDNVVRLHIIANSDSDADQAVKYAVRDAILEQSSEIFADAQSKESAETEIASKLTQIEDIAKNTVSLAGYDYSVSAQLVNMYFTTRQYGNVTVPAGRYDAVRITLGEAAGQNWWCVMFPPMCVPAAAEKDALPIESQIGELGSNPRYKPKFAVVELIESVREAMRSKNQETQVSLTSKGHESIYVS